jgi:hypothetical protein
MVALGGFLVLWDGAKLDIGGLPQLDRLRGGRG